MLLTLIYPQGIKAPLGALAERRPSGTYPDLYAALPPSVRDQFVCVDWLTPTEQENGYYLDVRFTEWSQKGDTN